MSKEVAVIELSEEKVKEAGQILQGWENRRDEYSGHKVYYIEDNQKILFIPGSWKTLRRKCVYDQTTKKLLIVPPLEKNVKRVKDPQVMKELNELIKHPIRSFNKGIFIRRLCPSGLPDHYCDLLEVMHGYDIPRVINPKTLKEESKYSYGRRKQQYLNMVFDLVISEG